VEAVGPEVSLVRPGDRVTGDCSLFCGACDLCADDRNLCQHIEKYGNHRGRGVAPVFPAGRALHLPASPDADLDLVALAEPLAVGAHAAARVAAMRLDLPREKVLVLGGGTIGLSCFFALVDITAAATSSCTTSRRPARPGRWPWAPRR